MGLLLDPLRAAQNVSGGNEHRRQDQLFYRVGVGARGVEDDNAVLTAPVDGDIVGAGPRAGDGPERFWKFVVVHGGGAHQDTVLVGYVGTHLKAGLVKLVQTYAGDFI